MACFFQADAWSGPRRAIRARTRLERVRGADGVRQLRGQRRGDGVEVEVRAAVVDRHLPPLARLARVAEALRARALALTS